MADPIQSDPVSGVSPAQFTRRAILTGMTLGALLVPCNVYSGLKIGWSFNMSIAAALLSLGFWRMMRRAFGTDDWGMLENNINQTSASSAASIVSAGLVAPIPALTLLTGEQLTWAVLAFWTFCVSLIGVMVALGLRRQMLIEEQLPFPAGMATAEVMRDIHDHGQEALARLRILLLASLVSGGAKLVDGFVMKIPKPGFPSGWGWSAAGVSKVTFKQLGFVIDPSLLMIGFGSIVGIRVGASLLLGALLAWGLLGPWALAQGWAETPSEEAGPFWFSSLVKWLLWPGVTLMVTASLTSFWLLYGKKLKLKSRRLFQFKPRESAADEIPAKGFVLGFIATLALGVIAQVVIFDIAFWIAVLAVLFSYLLAVVAGRVSGETGIPPIGALGKVTQLTFGLLSPGNATANLMAANVTGGAAGQCSDLLHDLKTGWVLGASPRLQSLAQVFGILAGSLAGTAAYLVLIPDPQSMLLTREWPAPAVATWKAVAEVFQDGLTALPEGSAPAMGVAAVLGIALGWVEKKCAERGRVVFPSPASFGLAFIIPAWISITLFLGGAMAWALERRVPDWHRRFLMVLAAGLVAGESLAGVLHALIRMALE